MAEFSGDSGISPLINKNQLAVNYFKDLNSNLFENEHTILFTDFKFCSKLSRPVKK
jgi:hypothetical protein